MKSVFHCFFSPETFDDIFRGYLCFSSNCDFLCGKFTSLIRIFFSEMYDLNLNSCLVILRLLSKRKSTFFLMNFQLKSIEVFFSEVFHVNLRKKSLFHHVYLQLYFMRISTFCFSCKFNNFKIQSRVLISKNIQVFALEIYHYPHFFSQMCHFDFKDCISFSCKFILCDKKTINL